MRSGLSGHAVLELRLTQQLEATTKDFLASTPGTLRPLDRAASVEQLASGRKLRARARLVVLDEGGGGTANAAVDEGEARGDRGLTALRAVVHALSRPASGATPPPPPYAASSLTMLLQVRAASSSRPWVPALHARAHREAPPTHSRPPSVPVPCSGRRLSAARARVCCWQACPRKQARARAPGRRSSSRRAAAGSSTGLAATRTSLRRRRASAAAPPRSEARFHRAQAQPASPRPRCPLPHPSWSAREAWTRPRLLPSPRPPRSAPAAARPNSLARQGGVDPHDRRAHRAIETAIAMGSAAHHPSRDVHAPLRARHSELHPHPLPKPLRRPRPTAIVQPVARRCRPQRLLSHPRPHPPLPRRPRWP